MFRPRRHGYHPVVNESGGWAQSTDLTSPTIPGHEPTALAAGSWVDSHTFFRIIGPIGPRRDMIVMKTRRPAKGTTDGQGPAWRRLAGRPDAAKGGDDRRADGRAIAGRLPRPGRGGGRARLRGPGRAA